jgi:hypothetical protein
MHTKFYLGKPEGKRPFGINMVEVRCKKFLLRKPEGKRPLAINRVELRWTQSFVGET